jgi:integrase
MGNAAVGGTTPNTVFSSVRSREYLTGAEIERLMAAARASSRYGHRDATMILLGYRHGLRASELCDLEWSQIELATGRLHVRRAKNGSPSVHPMRGDEIRALRRLHREQRASSHVFQSERGGPMTPVGRWLRPSAGPAAADHLSQPTVGLPNAHRCPAIFVSLTVHRIHSKSLLLLSLRCPKGKPRVSATLKSHRIDAQRQMRR